MVPSYWAYEVCLSRKLDKKCGHLLFTNEASLITEVWSSNLKACAAKWTFITLKPCQAVPGWWVLFGLGSQQDVAPGFHKQEFKMLAGEGTPETGPGTFIEEVWNKSYFKVRGKTL